MTDSARREARLRPEYEHLYPGITPDHWDSADALTDRILVLQASQGGTHRHRISGRVLPPKHFEFRGDTARPTPLREGQSRRGDQQFGDDV